MRWQVTLNGNASRAYECEDLVEWVLRRRRDLMTHLPMERVAILPLEGIGATTDSAAAAEYIKRKLITMRPTGFGPKGG